VPAYRAKLAARVPPRGSWSFGLTLLAILIVGGTTDSESHMAGRASRARSPRSVGRGLVKLKAAGVLNWLRRCVEDWIDGRFTLR